MRPKGKKQLGLFKQDMSSTIREDGIPVYRVSLVRRVGCLVITNKSAVPLTQQHCCIRILLMSIGSILLS